VKVLSLALALSLLVSSIVPAGAQTVRAIRAPGSLGSPFGAVSAAPAAFAPASVLSAAALPLVVPSVVPIAEISAEVPVHVQVPAAEAPALSAAGSLGEMSAAMSRPDPRGDVSAAAFDGAILSPAFEPPTVAPRAPSAEMGEEPVAENVPQRPQLSFQPAAKSSLLAIEPGRGLNGAMKLVKDNPYSRDWWSAYRKGAEIDVVIRGENVYNRPTKITAAVTKSIGKLTREDFEGTVPAHLLQVGIAALRKNLISTLEENRKRWSPEQPPVSLDSKVRVIKFQSYLELFRQAHGPDAVAKPEAPVERAPLKVKPEGVLKRLALFLPRAVFLDLDLFDGPISKEILSDIAKLQRTGVYFVAFSRKPYDAPGSMKEKLVRQLSAYQMSVLMPIRFMMVTDDGAVISELPRGGSPAPVDVLRFSPSEIDVLRDAAMKASEQVGLPPRSLEEIRQAPLEEDAGERFGRKDDKRPLGADPRVRFEVRLPKSLSAADFARWRASFDAVLKAQGLTVKTSVALMPDGRRAFTVARTDLAGSMERLRSALGEKFGLYMNPGDALVLSADPAVMAANPKTLDFAKATGLKGTELVDNALGLMLGEHRDNVEGDLAGSASRMISFSYNKGRYLSEALIQTDREEQNINFFSGHVVHSAEDWLIWNLQNGRVPTKAEFSAHLRRRWDDGMREFKAVGLPPAHLSESWLRASLMRAESMYDIVVRTYRRKEILIGSEIPNFFMLKDFARRTGELKRRYILHTIFDFIALRPDPKRPGHATLVIYDFKTGPAKTRPKLNKDIQVLTYALFAHEKWVGEKFPAPYLAGGKSYVIDDVSVEFIYSLKLQPADINRWGLDAVRRKIIGTLNRINAAEQKLYGYTPGGKPAPAKGKAKAKKKAAAKPKKKAAPKPKAQRG